MIDFYWTFVFIIYNRLSKINELLIERSLDFLDLSIEKKFFQIHKEIFLLIEKKRPEEAANLIQADILDVTKKLKGSKSGAKGAP